MNWKFELREFVDWDNKLARKIISVLEAAERERDRRDLPIDHPLRIALDDLATYLETE